VELQLARKSVGQRDGAAAAPGLRLAVLAPVALAPDSDLGGGPVDVAPAKRHELALPGAAHRGGQVQHSVSGGEQIVRHLADHGLDLVQGEEADVGVSPSTGGRSTAATGLDLAQPRLTDHSISPCRKVTWF
jgi:hypothetical protein